MRSGQFLPGARECRAQLGFNGVNRMLGSRERLSRGTDISLVFVPDGKRYRNSGHKTGIRAFAQKTKAAADCHVLSRLRLFEFEGRATSRDQCLLKRQPRVARELGGK